MAERKKLTKMQRDFCRFYAEGKSPKEAAKQAGYQNAVAAAGKMMQMPKIQKQIERLKKAGKGADVETAVAEKDEILCFLTEMMREDEDPKLRMKAAELLGKRESLFEKTKEADDRCRVIIVDDIP